MSQELRAPTKEEYQELEKNGIMTEKNGIMIFYSSEYALHCKNTHTGAEITLYRGMSGEAAE